MGGASARLGAGCMLGVWGDTLARAVQSALSEDERWYWRKTGVRRTEGEPRKRDGEGECECECECERERGCV